MEAIESKALRTSTTDANILRGQVVGGVIFSAFSDQARAGIWTRLQMADGLVPSLSTFFKDVHYLEALAYCVIRLTRLLPGETVSTALARAFSDTAGRTDRADPQVAESSFTSYPARSFDPVDLGFDSYVPTRCATTRKCLKVPKPPPEKS